jgi:SAM-dependent methyltransferase
MTRLEDFYFYNELGEKYPESEIVYSSKAGKIREAYLGGLLSRREGLTLDVGCNDGHYKRFIESYVGLDPALALLKKFKGSRLRAVAESLPFNASSFETVFISETLEHLHDRDLVLRECHRVLNKNGVLILSVPFGFSEWAVSDGDRTWETLKKYGVKYYPYLHGQFSGGYTLDLLAKARFRITMSELLSGPTRDIQRRLIMVAEKN